MTSYIGGNVRIKANEDWDLSDEIKYLPLAGFGKVDLLNNSIIGLCGHNISKNAFKFNEKFYCIPCFEKKILTLTDEEIDMAVQPHINSVEVADNFDLIKPYIKQVKHCTDIKLESEHRVTFDVNAESEQAYYQILTQYNSPLSIIQTWAIRIKSSSVLKTRVKFPFDVYYNPEYPHRDFADLSFALKPINNLIIKVPAFTEIVASVQPISNYRKVFDYLDDIKYTRAWVSIEKYKSNAVVCTTDVEHDKKVQQGCRKPFDLTGYFWEVSGELSQLAYGLNIHYSRPVLSWFTKHAKTRKFSNSTTLRPSFIIDINLTCSGTRETLYGTYCDTHLRYHLC